MMKWMGGILGAFCCASAEQPYDLYVAVICMCLSRGVLEILEQNGVEWCLQSENFTSRWVFGVFVHSNLRGT